MDKNLARMSQRERMLLMSNMFPSINPLMLSIGYEESNHNLYNKMQFVQLIYGLKTFSSAEIINIVNKYYANDIIYYCHSTSSVNNFEFKFTNRAKIIKKEMRYDVENSTEYVYGARFGASSTQYNVKSAAELAEFALNYMKIRVEAEALVREETIIQRNYSIDKINTGVYSKFKLCNLDKVPREQKLKFVFDEALMFEIDEHIYPLYQKFNRLGFLGHIGRFNENKILRLTDGILRTFIIDNYEANSIPNNVIENLMDSTVLVCMSAAIMKLVLIDRIVHININNEIVKSYEPKGTGVYENVLYFFDLLLDKFFAQDVEKMVDVLGKRFKIAKAIDATYKLLIKTSAPPIAFRVNDDFTFVSVPEKDRARVMKILIDKLSENDYYIDIPDRANSKMLANASVTAAKFAQEQAMDIEQANGLPIFDDKNKQIAREQTITNATIGAKKVLTKLHSIGIQSITEDALINFGTFVNKNRDTGSDHSTLTNITLINFYNNLSREFGVDGIGNIIDKINGSSDVVRAILYDLVNEILSKSNNNGAKFEKMFHEARNQIDIADVSINSYEYKKQKSNELNELRYTTFLKLTPQEKIENNITKMTHEQIVQFLDEKIRNQLMEE